MSSQLLEDFDLYIESLGTPTDEELFNEKEEELYEAKN